MTAVLGRGLVVTDGDPEEIVAASVPPPAPPVQARDEALPPRPDAPPPAAPPARLRRAWVIPAAVVVAGALALLPNVGDHGPGPGEAEVRVEGAATVTRSGGEVDVVEDASVRLGPGDSIEVTAGTAHFALAGDVAFTGRVGPAVADRDGTTVLMGRIPELVAGPLLVETPVPVQVRAAGGIVTVGPAPGGDGAVRIDRRIGLGVGTYAGTATVESGGQSRSVPPFRRLEVAGPGAFGRPGPPLEYSDSDPWDRRFLAGALAVDRQLGPLLAAFDAVAGPGPTTAEVVDRALPGLPRAGRDDVVAGAPSGSAALVTAVLADLGPDATFVARVAAIRRFRDAGAPWGLVTLDQRVAPDALLDGIRAALDRLGLDGVSVGAGEDTAALPPPALTGGGLPTGSEAPEVTAPTAPGSDGGQGTPPAAPGSGGGPGSGSGPSSPNPPPVVPLPGAGGAIGEVVDGVGDVVDDVLGGVGDVVSEVGDALGQVVDGAGNLLGDVVDGLLDTAGRILGPPASPSEADGPGLLGLGGR